MAKSNQEGKGLAGGFWNKGREGEQEKQDVQGGGFWVVEVEAIGPKDWERRKNQRGRPGWLCQEKSVGIGKRGKSEGEGKLQHTAERLEKVKKLEEEDHGHSWGGAGKLE